MIVVLGALIAGILAVLAAIHVYWAAGGRWGTALAIPQKADGSSEQAFTPSTAATLAVALALSAAATLIAMRSGLVTSAGLPARYLTVGTWILGGVFMLRAIGDFRLIGFFKRVRGTPFARADSAFFSPLCLALAGGCACIALS
jgi:hypothetical protein